MQQKHCSNKMLFLAEHLQQWDQRTCLKWETNASNTGVSALLAICTTWGKQLANCIQECGMTSNLMPSSEHSGRENGLSNEPVFPQSPALSQRQHSKEPEAHTSGVHMLHGGLATKATLHECLPTGQRRVDGRFDWKDWQTVRMRTPCPSFARH